MKDRPFGVVLMAVLIAIEAILQILAALALFGLSIVGLFSTPYTGAAAALLAMGSVVLLVGIVELVVSSGLWSLEKWAWMIAVIVVWIDLVFDIIGGIAGTQTLTATIVSMIIPLIVLVYLYQPNIRKLFD